MSELNLSSITAKIQEAYKSESFGNNHAGWAGVTETKKNAIIKDLINILYDSIITARPALESGFSKSDITSKTNPKGTIEIHFNRKATSRKSLFVDREEDKITGDREEDKRTGDGVENIVALFSRGYEAKKYAYGYWNRAKVRTHTNKNTGKPGLESNDFLNEAINIFNLKYSTYGANATLSSEYLNGTF